MQNIKGIIGPPFSHPKACFAPSVVVSTLQPPFDEVGQFSLEGRWVQDQKPTIPAPFPHYKQQQQQTHEVQ